MREESTLENKVELKHGKIYQLQSTRLRRRFIFISISIRIRSGRRRLEGREWIGAFDDPAKGEKRYAGENSGAPSLRVPPAVLSYSEAPLISESGGVGIHRLSGFAIVAGWGWGFLIGDLGVDFAHDFKFQPNDLDVQILLHHANFAATSRFDLPASASSTHFFVFSFFLCIFPFFFFPFQTMVLLLLLLFFC